MTNHAKQRAEQRYNTFLNKKDRKKILKMITHNKCYPLEYENLHYKNRRLCYVVFNHIPLKIIYAISKNNRAVALVTMLPFDVEEFNEIINV